MLKKRDDGTNSLKELTLSNLTNLILDLAFSFSEQFFSLSHLRPSDILYLLFISPLKSLYKINQISKFINTEENFQSLFLNHSTAFRTIHHSFLHINLSSLSLCSLLEVSFSSACPLHGINPLVFCLLLLFVFSEKS